MSTIKSTLTSNLPFYSIGEEITNSILHGIGTIAAITGLVLLGLKTTGFFGTERLGSIDIVAVFIFTATMIALFLISTLYHAIQHQGAKKIFRKLDHCIIFIFIAGTYTPFCLSGLKGAWGWGLFGFEWAMALTGITLNFLEVKSLKKFEVAAYIMMGWAVLVGFVPLLRSSIPVPSIVLLLVGGAAYTLGVIWYRMKSVKFTHAVWHVFVILGTVCHWFAIWYLI